MNKSIIIFRLGCFFVIATGIKMYTRGTDGIYGIEVPPEAAILFCIIGIFFFIYSFFPKVKKEAEKYEKGKKTSFCDTDEMICEECNSKYKTEYIQIPICPKCDGKLVPFTKNDKRT